MAHVLVFTEETLPHALNSSSTLQINGNSSCCGLITLRLSLNLFEGGTGCHEWEAGFFLAEFIMNFPSLFQGHTICLCFLCLIWGCWMNPALPRLALLTAALPDLLVA